MKANIFILFLFLISFFASGSEVILKGKSKGYLNDKIPVYTVKDYITGEKQILAEISFKPDGSFQTSIKTDKILLIFFDLYVFKGSMYVEPGKTYNIELPDKTLPNQHDKYNPFFEQINHEIFINDTNTRELNYVIGTFDVTYNKFLVTNSTIAGDKLSKQADTISLIFNNYFSFCKHPYFQTYKKYKLGYMRQMAHKLTTENAIRSFFTFNPVKFDNPAYMELFNSVFQDFFIVFSKTLTGSGIISIVEKEKSYKSMKKFLLNHNLMFKNDTLVDLVILKGIHDGFYNFCTEVGMFKNRIPSNQLLMMLDSFSLQTNIEEFKYFAANIKEKVTRLMPGYPAPDFILKDQKKQDVSLKNFRGKYVYLIFGTTWDYTCKQEFDQLAPVMKQFGDSLQILVISADEKFEDIAAFLKDKNLKIPFLFAGENKSLLEKYGVTAYPTCFVVDKEGNFFISPANAPSGYFDKQFVKKFGPPDERENPMFDDLFDRNRE